MRVSLTLNGEAKTIDVDGDWPLLWVVRDVLPIIYGPYRMATLRDAPREIDIELLQGADRPGGVGEPPLGPIGAAIANAVARLTGKRPRAMPLVAPPVIDAAG